MNGVDVHALIAAVLYHADTFRLVETLDTDDTARRYAGMADRLLLASEWWRNTYDCGECRSSRNDSGGLVECEKCNGEGRYELGF